MKHMLKMFAVHSNMIGKKQSSIFNGRDNYFV